VSFGRFWRNGIHNTWPIATIACDDRCFHVSVHDEVEFSLRESEFVVDSECLVNIPSTPWGIVVECGNDGPTYGKFFFTSTSGEVGLRQKESEYTNG